MTDLVEGTGEPAKKGDSITVNYVGVRSEDGTEFDNSYDRGQPYTLTLGEGGVIAGWDEGLIGAKAGGWRQLDIPAALAYGDQGAGEVIKPGGALSFVIDVVSITPAPVPPTLAPMADPSECPEPDGSSEQQQEFTDYPPTCIDVTKAYTAEIETNMGPLTVELYPATAPLAVNSFVTLARYHYFDGIDCHRIVPQFVAQCGDPTGNGQRWAGLRVRRRAPGGGGVPDRLAGDGQRRAEHERLAVLHHHRPQRRRAPARLHVVRQGDRRARNDRAEARRGRQSGEQRRPAAAARDDRVDHDHRERRAARHTGDHDHCACLNDHEPLTDGPYRQTPEWPNPPPRSAPSSASTTFHATSSTRWMTSWADAVAT